MHLPDKLRRTIEFSRRPGVEQDEDSVTTSDIGGTDEENEGWEPHTPTDVDYVDVAGLVPIPGSDSDDDDIPVNMANVIMSIPVSHMQRSTPLEAAAEALWKIFRM